MPLNNTHKQFLVTAVFAALTTPLVAYAASAPSRCVDVDNDAQRLACYDAENGRRARPGGGGAAVAPATAATAAAAATAVAVAPVPAASPPAPEPQPAVVNSSVTAVKRTADERFVVTLENGQVWEQMERDKRIDFKVGDKVVLRRLTFGSYTLATRIGITLRVKRVN